MGHSSAIGPDFDGEETPTFLRENPFYRPIVDFFQSIRQVKWRFPFIANMVQILILCLIIIATIFLFATIGIAAQIANTFIALIQDTRRRAHQGSSVEKSAYMMATGVYLLLLLPFWLVQLPFQFLGWCWGKFGIFAFVMVMLLAAAGYAIYAGLLPVPKDLDSLKVYFGH